MFLTNSQNNTVALPTSIVMGISLSSVRLDVIKQIAKITTATLLCSRIFGRFLLYFALLRFRYNGYLPAGERGRRRSKFVLYRRPQPNGVRRSKHYVVKTPHSSKAILDASQHSISYTLSRSQAVIVEYTEDLDTDMFQVS